MSSGSLSEIIKSIQPVITKVDFNSEELNENDDLDILKATLLKYFKNYLENLKKEKLKEINCEKLTNSTRDSNTIEDEQLMEQDIDELAAFLDIFASKIVIYDPLDR